jgi:putative membrane protein
MYSTTKETPMSPKPTRDSRRTGAITAAAVCALAAFACAKADTAADTSAATSPPPATAAPAINDAQIAHIAVTANAIDSAAGELAKQKGSSKEVRDFAQTMITDHGAVNKEAVALATKLGVNPQDNDVSRSLTSGAETNTTTLNGLSGAPFDKAYIDHEATYHQAVLDALDKTLIPNAQNGELKALLEKVRPAIAAHLDHAKRIQAALPK